MPPLFVGMLPVLLVAGLILALSIPGTTSESATLRFLGQTDFVVNETSAAVIRLVVERVGDPVNVTALVLVGHGRSSSLMTHCVSILINPSSHLFRLYLIAFLCCWAVTFISSGRENPNCLGNHRISFTSFTWGLVSAAHNWCLVRRAGPAVECSWGVSYASWYLSHIFSDMNYYTWASLLVNEILCNIRLSFQENNGHRQ